MKKYAIFLLSATSAFATIDGNTPDLIDDIKPHRMTYEKELHQLCNHGFIFEVMDAENSIKAGWNPITRRWYPHPSPEGGTPTIAYGHKLTTKEYETNYFKNGITEKQAQDLLISDIQKSLDRMWIDAIDWNELTWQQQWLLLDFQFNLGNVYKKFPKFTAAVLNNNKVEMLKEYKRYYRDAKGKRHEVKDRNARTLKFIKENF